MHMYENLKTLSVYYLSDCTLVLGIGLNINYSPVLYKLYVLDTQSRAMMCITDRLF